jgi:putative transposase
MHFEEGFTYHIYNRSNQRLYKTRENYLYFLEKFRNYILPYSDVIAWCLMSNHFHFMLIPNKNAVEMVKEKHLPHTQVLSKQFGTFLSSYTKAFNKQNRRRGSLFAHNTEAKLLNKVYNTQNNQTKLSYPVNCFRYIHYNPVEANLVESMHEWEFSSYNDYAGNRNGSLVNKKLAMQMINYNEDNFEKWSLMDLEFL